MSANERNSLPVSPLLWAQRRASGSTDYLSDIQKLLKKTKGDAFTLLKNSFTDENKEFKEALKDGMKKYAEDKLKEQGEALLKKVPMGNVLFLGGKLALAFANGAGQELVATNDNLRLQYDNMINNIDPDDGISAAEYERLEKIRRWQLISVKKLNPIMLKGLENMVSEAVDMGAGKLAEKLQNKETKIGRLLSDNKAFVSAAAKAAGIDGAEKKPVEETLKSVGKGISKIIFEALGEDDFTNGIVRSVSHLRPDSDKNIEYLAGLAKAYVSTRDLSYANHYPNMDQYTFIDIVDAIKGEFIAVGSRLKEEIDGSSIVIESSGNNTVSLQGKRLRVPDIFLGAITLGNRKTGIYLSPSLRIWGMFDAYDAFVNNINHLERIDALLTVMKMNGVSVKSGKREDLYDTFLKHSHKRAREIERAYAELNYQIKSYAIKNNLYSVLGYKEIREGYLAVWGCLLKMTMCEIGQYRKSRLNEQDFKTKKLIGAAVTEYK